MIRWGVTWLPAVNTYRAAEARLCCSAKEKTCFVGGSPPRRITLKREHLFQALLFLLLAARNILVRGKL
jgi:hypothetical protein